jgi:hypothetical protein
MKYYANGIQVTKENKLDKSSTISFVKKYKCEHATPYDEYDTKITKAKIIKKFVSNGYEFIVQESEVMDFSFGTMTSSQPRKRIRLLYQPKK